ncbi:HTH cro/C1-type domain-containing protein [Nocardia ninae]
MTPEQLARKIEVNPKTVERWITQGRVPYPVHQFAVAVAIGVPERELWPEGYTHHRSRHLQSVPEASEPRSSTDHNSRDPRPGVGESGTVLKSLLQERHWQTLSAFRREYDRVAAQCEPHMVGRAPAKAQFYRWLSGDLKGMPYPDHCRVLEAMLPGTTAEEMFTRKTSSTTSPRPNRPAQPEPMPATERPHLSACTGSARMRALMSWVDVTSPLKERDIHAGRERPQDHRTYSRGGGVQRSR